MSAPSRARVGLSLALAVVLPLLGACDRLAGGGDRSVLFAVTGPFQLPIGESTRLGAELAAREVNAEGGIGGRPLELRLMDDEASPQRAIEIAHDLVADREVVAVAGPVNSGSTYAAGPVYDGRLPILSTTSTSPGISALGPWVYRVASSDAANTEVLARNVHSISARTAILYSNDTFGRGLGAAFRDAFVGLGGEVAQMDPYLEEMEDFRPYLARLDREGLEVIFIAGIDRSAARIIEQAREMGIRSVFVGSSALEKLAALGPQYEGTRVGMLYHPEATDAARRFAEAYRTAYGREPDSFAACAYDAVRLLALAAREEGAGRADVQRYLRLVGAEGGRAPFEGAAGTVRFDENGDPTEKRFTIGTIRAGRLAI